MLAGDTHAHHIAIEGMQRGQVFQQNAFHFVQRRCRQVLARAQVMLDLAEDPRPPLGGATDQQAVGAGGVQHRPGLLWRGDVAVGENRDRHRLLDRGDGVVLGFTGVQVGACAAMHRQRLDTGLFGDLRHVQAVLVRPVPAGADLQRHRDLHCADHGMENLVDQGFISQ